MNNPLLEVELVSHSEHLQKRIKGWMHTEEADYFVKHLQFKIKEAGLASLRNAIQSTEFPNREPLVGKELEEAKRLQLVLDTWIKFGGPDHEFQTLKN